MSFFVIKLVLSALLIASISELSKRSVTLGATLASLPLISVLSMVWIQTESRDSTWVQPYCNEILWLIAPSLVLFMLLPILIQKGLSFYPSLLIACAATALCYLLVTRIREGKIL